MFNDTVQSGQVCVNLSEELMLPEAVVSEVELTIFRVKTLTVETACVSETGSTHLARLHSVRPEDRNVSLYSNGNKS
jgi:hypothetical protein